MAKALPIVVQLEILRAQGIQFNLTYFGQSYLGLDEDDLFIEECRKATKSP
jgi:hypothetical protein